MRSDANFFLKACEDTPLMFLIRSIKRARPEHVWTFYAGNGVWSPKVRDAISVFNGGPGILSVSWNSFLQRYVAVYSAVFSENVMIRTSSEPEGPWSGETVAFVAMMPSTGNVYDAHAHPEYDVSDHSVTLKGTASRGRHETRSSTLFRERPIRALARLYKELGLRQTKSEAVNNERICKKRPHSSFARRRQSPAVESMEARLSLCLIQGPRQRRFRAKSGWCQ